MITCNQYDYIEIVCTFQYPIRLVLTSGAIVEGKALDTGLDEDRNECIKVSVNDLETWVVLDQISKLEVLVENPHFSTVVFD